MLEILISSSLVCAVVYCVGYAVGYNRAWKEFDRLTRDALGKIKNEINMI
jgi:hypothetical protein